MSGLCRASRGRVTIFISDQRNNFHPLYTLYTPCNPVVLQGVFVLKCLLTEDVLLKIENTYRGSEMKILKSQHRWVTNYADGLVLTPKEIANISQRIESNTCAPTKKRQR